MKSYRGFTLIELIVSFSIFIVLVTLTTATFAQALRSQRVVSDLSVSMNEVSFATEQMMREIRTGANFQIKNVAGEEAFQLTNANNEQVNYRYGRIEKRIERCFLPAGTTGECGDYKALTSPAVKISTLKFILKGSGGIDGAARVTIITAVTDLRGIVNVNLETTVSARVLE